MTAQSAGPLSRWIAVGNLPPEGIDVTVEASPEERQALAAEFNLVAIHSLTGSFRVSGSLRRVEVSGGIEAEIDQVCVVTLEPFTAQVREHVEVAYAAPGTAAPDDQDPPDEIVNGQVDLGALTAEFLALGLDPYPRKPGAGFAYEPADSKAETPFAALAKLKRDK